MWGDPALVQRKAVPLQPGPGEKGKRKKVRIPRKRGKRAPDAQPMMKGRKGKKKKREGEKSSRRCWYLLRVCSITLPRS